MPLAPAPLRPAVGFCDIHADAPNDGGYTRQYRELHGRLDAAVTAEDWLGAVRAWDDLRRSLQTWEALVELRFRQNTKDAAFRADSETLNAIRPKLEELNAAIKRRLLDSPIRARLIEELGQYVFDRWACEVSAVDARNAEASIDEATLCDDYTAILAGAHIRFESHAYSLSDIARFAEDGSRDRREASTRAKWAFYAANAERIDDIYDRLVANRTQMAHTLGLDSFVELGYRRMLRTDYGPSDVAAYRAAIERDVVPVCSRIAHRQAQTLGIDRLRIWDERVFHPLGAPIPPASCQAIVEAARGAFAAIDPTLADFTKMMFDGELLDLQGRDGKAGGGFCTSFADFGLPYIFANFNASTHDVNVLLHEMGHAFQCYSSRTQALQDQLWPTYDACEIHSMSMEFLAWPQLGRFFGAQASRYRREHLAASLLALPYSVAVDHFQHLVYEHPDATPQRRREFWKELETRYLPWRDNGGIEHLESGGLWHAQRHIFVNPFYYIDYSLAMSCALQFWAASTDDYAATLERYVTLCKRGGTAGFTELVRSAGLQSPFEAGVPRVVLDRVEAMLLTD